MKIAHGWNPPRRAEPWNYDLIAFLLAPRKRTSNLLIATEHAIALRID